MNLTFVSALMTVASAQSPNPSCVQLDERVIHARVDATMEAADLPSRTNALGLLYEYWSATCEEARTGANETVVDELSRLLEIDVARLTASSLLLQVGPSLAHAERAVTLALADQERIDDEAARAAAPLVPPTGRMVSTSLRCVVNKIQTGLIDDNLCQYLQVPGIPPD